MCRTCADAPRLLAAGRDKGARCHISHHIALLLGRFLLDLCCSLLLLLLPLLLLGMLRLLPLVVVGRRRRRLPGMLLLLLGRQASLLLPRLPSLPRILWLVRQRRAPGWLGHGRAAAAPWH